MYASPKFVLISVPFSGSFDSGKVHFLRNVLSMDNKILFLKVHSFQEKRILIDLEHRRDIFMTWSQGTVKSQNLCQINVNFKIQENSKFPYSKLNVLLPGISGGTLFHDPLVTNNKCSIMEKCRSMQEALKTWR